jgi:hypothetical protein
MGEMTDLEEVNRKKQQRHFNARPGRQPYTHQKGRLIEKCTRMGEKRAAASR